MTNNFRSPEFLERKLHRWWCHDCSPGYRGQMDGSAVLSCHWCPYCRQQLMDFQRSLEQFHEIGAEVVALSVDPIEQAQQTVEKHNLTFPVLYGLDAHDIARKIGANVNENPLYLQATGFVV